MQRALPAQHQTPAVRLHRQPQNAGAPLRFSLWAGKRQRISVDHAGELQQEGCREQDAQDDPVLQALIEKQQRAEREGSGKAERPLPAAVLGAQPAYAPARGGCKRQDQQAPQHAGCHAAGGEDRDQIPLCLDRGKQDAYASKGQDKKSVTLPHRQHSFVAENSVLTDAACPDAT